MEVERTFMDTPEFSQPGFGVTPEAFNTINMSFSSKKFVLSMMYSKMFFVSQINPVCNRQAIQYIRASHLNE